MASRTKRAGRPVRTIQSVDRAIAIVQALCQEPSGMKLSVLASRLGLAAQTVQSLVRTLQAHGWAEQAGRGGAYTMGAGLHVLARRWSAGLDRPQAAAAIVKDLSSRIGEYVLLTEFRAGRLIHLVEAAPQRGLTVSPGVEASGHLHTMATARVLLAYADVTEQKAAIATMNFSPVGPKSITGRDEFSRQLALTKARGYALCIEEASEDCAALAVPLQDSRGAVVAALGIAAPLTRFAKPRREELLAELNLAARRIAAVWRL